MQGTSPTVLVIDDDPDLRVSLGILLRSAGLTTQLFEFIPDFLRANRPDGSACLVLDVRLPGASGLDFQRELATANIKLPIIFITGYGDIPMSVQAMKGGAVEFLTKPFRQQELLDAIYLALAQDQAHQEQERASSALKERLKALSSREREIMIHAAQGRLSKQIAGDLGISETTVNVHRSNLMRKMKAGSIAELGRMADQLNLIPDKPQISRSRR